MQRRCLLLLSAALLVATASASVYDDKFNLDTTLVWMRNEALWAPGSLMPSPPGNGRSEVKFDYNVVVPKGAARNPDATDFGNAFFLVFHSKDMDKVGFLMPGEKKATRRFCCAQDLYDKVEESMCSPDKLHDVMIHPALDNVLSAKIALRPEGEVSRLEETFKVKESGVHYAMTLSCEGLVQSYEFSGSNVWINPYGYLPGRQYAYLPFYAVLSVAYVGVALLWATASAWHWRELLQIQIYITILVFIGMVEMFAWTTYYSSWNISGQWSGFLLVCSLVSSAGKRTMSRVLVLMVSMGWGTVKPYLQRVTKQKIAIVAAIYFCCSTIFDLLTKSGFTYYVEVPEIVQIVFIFPIALLDSIFYWWIFLELSGIISHLEQRRMTIKLNLYRKFQRVLIVSILLSALCITVHMYSTTAYEPLELWDTAWVFDAYWEALYFVIMAAIMFLWRPNKNSQAYAYSEVTNQAPDDAEAIEMGDSSLHSNNQAGDGWRRSSGGEEDEQNLGYSFTVDDEDDKAD